VWRKPLFDVGSSAPPAQGEPITTPCESTLLESDSKKNEQLQQMKRETIRQQRTCQEQRKKTMTRALGNPRSVDQVAILDKQLPLIRKKYTMQRIRL
jgi:hypothetical protein